MPRFSFAGTIVPNPINLIETVHKQHAELCDQLEEIADSLPGSVDVKKCARVVHTLVVDLPLHHKDEEEGLFPLLQKAAVAEEAMGDHIEQLSWEHSADEGVAMEIAEAMEKLANGERAENPEMLGYLLRNFFEGYRRHLHWENTMLLPIARRALSKADLQKLNDIMAKNRFSTTGKKACNGSCETCEPEEKP